MALLLHIDTATNYGAVCISNDEDILAVEESRDQKTHGAFLQPAIERICRQAKRSLNNLDGIVVSAGPGSYTGLRVGLSTAKGLCYALEKPLIMVNTLDIMATAAIIAFGKNHAPDNFLFCPMIDARRMEVFTALYNHQLDYILSPSALILKKNYIEFFYHGKPVVFSGDGSIKFRDLNTIEEALFISVDHTVQQLILLGINAFRKKAFADLAYCEPFYIKEFFNNHSVI